MKVFVDYNYSSLKKVFIGGSSRLSAGLILFVLFINDLPDNVRNSLKLFADDLKLIGIADKRPFTYYVINFLAFFNPPSPL